MSIRRILLALAAIAPLAAQIARVAATRQLAKRQLTWLRSMPERHRVACDRPNRIEQVLNLAEQVWRDPKLT